MELSLEFSVRYDLELLEKNIALSLIRLLTRIEFKQGDSWSKPYMAIIDTGSPVSVFPATIQDKCDIQPLHQTSISGLVPDEKCRLSAKLVNLAFRLSDRENVTKPITSKAYIASTEKIPLILGLSDVLEKSTLTVDYPYKKAFLVFPD